MGKIHAVFITHKRLAVTD